MGTRPTTRCCSAGALIASLTYVLAASITGQSGVQAEPPPLSLFPIQTEWTLALNNQLVVPPTYVGSDAYFAIEGGRLAAYTLDNGRRKWIVQVGAVMEPVAGDGLIFIVEAQAVTAIRASDGTTAWQLPSPGMVAVPPVWDNGWLVLGTAAGEILAFRAIDGHLVWRRDLGSPAHSRPSLAADRVDVPLKDGRIIALRVDSGDSIWERRLGGPATGLLAVDDRIYAGSTDNFFYALDARDGRVAWRWRTGADVVGLPVVDDRHVYFVSFDNVLRALLRRNGVQQWARPLPLRPTRGPLGIGSTLLVSGIAPALRAYNMKDGTPAGDLVAPGEMAGPPYALPTVAGGVPRVLIATLDIGKGAVVTLFSRQIGPPLSPPAALPGSITPIDPEP